MKNTIETANAISLLFDIAQRAAIERLTKQNIAAYEARLLAQDEADTERRAAYKKRGQEDHLLPLLLTPSMSPSRTTPARGRYGAAAGSHP